MSNSISRTDLEGQAISRIVSLSNKRQDSFDYNRCLVLIGDRWLEIDSRGVDYPTDLDWAMAPDEPLTDCYPELVGLTISQVVTSDYLPTFGLLLDNEELLYSADLGPPFEAFGPLHEPLGTSYSRSSFVDYWNRSPLE